MASKTNWKQLLLQDPNLTIDILVNEFKTCIDKVKYSKLSIKINKEKIIKKN